MYLTFVPFSFLDFPGSEPLLLKYSSVYESCRTLVHKLVWQRNRVPVLKEEHDSGGGSPALLPEVSRGYDDFWNPSKKFCLSGVWMERPLGRCPFCKAHPDPGLLRGRAGCFGPDGTYLRSLVETQGVWAGGKPGTGQGQANLSCASPKRRFTRTTANTSEQDFH